MKSTISAWKRLGLYAVLAATTLSFDDPPSEALSEVLDMGRVTPITAILDNSCVNYEGAMPPKCLADVIEPPSSGSAVALSAIDPCTNPSSHGTKSILENRTNVITLVQCGTLAPLSNESKVVFKITWKCFRRNATSEWETDAPNFLSFDDCSESTCPKIDEKQTISCEKVFAKGAKPYRSTRIFLKCAQNPGYRAEVTVSAQPYVKEGEKWKGVHYKSGDECDTNTNCETSLKCSLTDKWDTFKR